MEDLWKEVFLCGTEWHTLKDVSVVKWDHSALDAWLEKEMAESSSETMFYVFGGTEPQMLALDQLKNTDNPDGRVVPIPIMVVAKTTTALPAELGINSVQMQKESVIPMSDMKMFWSPVEVASGKKRVRSRLFVLKCSQRQKAVSQLQEERVRKFDYCMPYIQFPHKEANAEVDTCVDFNITCPGRHNPIVGTYDWDLDTLQEFVDERMEEEALPADFRDSLKTQIRDHVRAVKAERLAAKAAKTAALEQIPLDIRNALKELRLHKFYPTAPLVDISNFKSTFINRYYGMAHQLH